MLNEIKEYWEEATPMNFSAEKWSYIQKRDFRYNLQDYMYESFGFQDFKGQRVLEVGCGSGLDAIEFAKNGAIVTAVDITDNAIQQTMQNSIEAGVSITVMPTLQSQFLPFPNDSFDLVYSFGVLHHIPDVEVMLQEIRRVLKPCGKFMGMVYNKDSLLFAYSIIYLHGIKNKKYLDSFSLGTIDKLTAQYSERIENCPYTKAYTKKEARELFGNYFKEVEIEVKYNVLDLPGERKVKIDIDDKWELGWHLIIKGVKV